MRTFRKSSILLILVGVLIGADAPSTRPAAVEAPMRKFNEAVAAADGAHDKLVAAADEAHDKAIDLARTTLLTDLTRAKKIAMTQDDLPGAVACEELIKANAQPNKPNVQLHKPEMATSAFGGITLQRSFGDTTTFLPDGSIQSAYDGSGSWHVLSPKSVVVIYSDHADWIRIYQLDENSKTFKATMFHSQGDFTGSLVK